ncbi:uncharacterized protein si:ch211-113d22.2 isoform X1 [Pygocentrus nattereri]|uniref:uncharacterized protein si:ch211-113d22.2 isoform X1 n=1 Tax=Pygocentrus nattereri TaxID=42514 RepID=UPI0018916D87|nr:uncharacterized protein si:ch211-113d22.2 isoform X1 [Pygocentrus nattereri]
MRTVVTLLLLLAAVLNTVCSCPVCEGEALKCHTCVAVNQEDCNRQGSAVCPAHADACSTITGPNSVMKSCSYKSFCEKSHMSVGGVKLECCFTEDCNGQHHSHSHGEHHNSAAVLSYSVTLLLGALLLKAL